jgi:2-methylcitrate dehydratase PrpD
MISRITVQTFERALRLNNYPDPASLEAAQYSIPFCLGVAAINGPDALLPLESTCLHDSAIATIARRVILMVDDSLNALFPLKTPARIIVETPSGRFEKTVIDTRGDPANPMTHADLTAKFRHLTRNFLPEKRQEHILESIMMQDEKGLPNLLLLIR